MPTAQHPIRAGDVVRTSKPFNGYYYGGVVQKIDVGTAWVRVEGEELPFPVGSLVASEPMVLLLSRLERSVGAMMDEGYTRAGDRVEIPAHTFEALLAVFRKARWPTEVPRARPMVIELEDEAPASWWKLL